MTVGQLILELMQWDHGREVVIGDPAGEPGHFSIELVRKMEDGTVAIEPYGHPDPCAVNY